jgi:hypothetical protein
MNTKKRSDTNHLHLSFLHEIPRYRRLFHFKYPKLMLFCAMILLSYWLFTIPSFVSWTAGLKHLGYIGIFLTGILFSYGFTTPLSIGLFMTMSPENLLLAAIVGGFGAFIADLLIFSFIRTSFLDEFSRLEATKPIRAFEHLIQKKLGSTVKAYLLYAFVGIIIASPLPDEIGITMLAGLTKIKSLLLSLISLTMNTVGIFVILKIGATL